MLKKITELGQFDPIAFTELLKGKIPGSPRPVHERLRLKLLDLMLNLGIPFNRWLGMRIVALSADGVTIESPPAVLRRNHVGTAHACAQALLGEYTAGLVVAQRFPTTDFRVIIGRLEIDYKRAGRGLLRGQAVAPETWPELVDDQAWVEMKTQITNDKGEEIAICTTRWQVKTWLKIKAERDARSSVDVVSSTSPERL